MRGYAVRVPASTSNLGPGFDLLGAALSLWLEVRVTGPVVGRHAWIRRTGEAASWPAEENLLLQAFDLARGTASPGFAFEVASAIPVARGLGSSGAAIAAGLLLGDAVVGRARTPAELFALGLPLEGHPDNLAAALFGGCRLSVPLSGRPAHLLAWGVHPSIGWAVACPEVRDAPPAARAVLPLEVPFADAAENPRRLALLLAGLESGAPELLADGLADRLHCERRLDLVPGSRGVLCAALAAGAYGATLSGSGSAQVALASREAAPKVAEAMAEAFRAATGRGTGAALEIVLGAPRVEPRGDPREGRESKV